MILTTSTPSLGALPNFASTNLWAAGFQRATGVARGCSGGRSIRSEDLHSPRTAARPTKPDLACTVLGLPAWLVLVLVAGKESGRNTDGGDARVRHSTFLEVPSRYIFSPRLPCWFPRGENPNSVGRRRRHGRCDLPGGTALG